MTHSNAKVQMDIKTVQHNFKPEPDHMLLIDALNIFTLYSKADVGEPYNVMITKTMIYKAQYASVVAPEFLDFIARNGTPVLRDFAGKHVNTPAGALACILYNEPEPYNSNAMYAALENPHTPFKAVLVGWYKVMPNSPLNLSPAVLDRKEEYYEMLNQYGLTVEDIKSLPAEWVISGLLEDVAVFAASESMP